MKTSVTALITIFAIFTHCEEESDNFSNKWEAQMSDYQPDFVNIIPIPFRRKEIFYEEIKIVPSRIRGAFLIDETKNEKIDFELIDPLGRVLITKTASHEIFDFEAVVKGVYKILFTNDYVSYFFNF
jgi:hypothetical protein